MNLRFNGTIKELKRALSFSDNDGQWSSPDSNQVQFRHRNGAILNWYPSTGTIFLQGKPEPRRELEQALRNALHAESESTSGGDAEKIQQTQDAETPPALNSISRDGPNGATFQERDAHNIDQTYSGTEVVIGLVGALGTDLPAVTRELESRLKVFRYDAAEIHVSDAVIPALTDTTNISESDYGARVNQLMTCGNEARRDSNDNAILARGVAAMINEPRPADDEGDPLVVGKKAYIINSLKHPDEVAVLRQIYSEGFFLIGVHEDEDKRRGFLENDKRVNEQDITSLIERDENENEEYGQKTSDTFHLSDFFLYVDKTEHMKERLWRFLDLIFGHPYKTPTFDEYAMFMAFCASLRSADLSRQVGAVVTNDSEILAMGSNDCPRYGGGLYWPSEDRGSGKISDEKSGRDYMRGEDSNTAERRKIIESIADQIARQIRSVSEKKEELLIALESSPIKDITEFGRAVHAEMEALLGCARNGISCRGGTLYCTTFPCHNCAKHIVAAGIDRVVYVEPYPKSKAKEFHDDAISLGMTKAEERVRFEPFVGIGPRRFIDLFSMRLGAGWPVRRKDSEGQTVSWSPEGAKLRIEMHPVSYIEREEKATSKFNDYRRQMGSDIK